MGTKVVQIKSMAIKEDGQIEVNYIVSLSDDADMMKVSSVVMKSQHFSEIQAEALAAANLKEGLQ